MSSRHINLNQAAKNSTKLRIHKIEVKHLNPIFSATPDIGGAGLPPSTSNPPTKGVLNSEFHSVAQHNRTQLLLNAYICINYA